MKRQIEEILNRQQEYEYLKKHVQPFNNLTHPPTAFTQRILIDLRKNNKKTSHHHQRLSLFKLFCLLIWIYFISSSLTIIFTNKQLGMENESAFESESFDYPVKHAESAIAENDFIKAKSILDEELEKHPTGFAIFCGYAELYEAQGKYDDAAKIMVKFLNDYQGTQDISNENVYLYKKLEEFSFPLSKEVRKEVNTCLTACELSIERFNNLDNLLENNDFSFALSLCNELKSTYQVSDNVLCSYYHRAYVGLKEYDKSAIYLLSLVDKANKDYLHYPDNSMISYYLKEIYDKLSPSLQKQIDASKFNNPQ